MENLARYIIRASFSQERMQYLDQEDGRLYIQERREVNQGSRRWGNGRPRCVWHIPNRGEQMVRYYGYYSNVSRENASRKV